MATEKLPNPREFADTRLAELRDAGKISASGDGSPLAGAVPTFSKGTAALDDDGQPIIPKSQQQVPSFQEQHVDLPKPTDTQGGAPPQAQEPAPAPSQPEPPPQQQAAAATEAVAQQIADEWDEFEFEDPDLNTKITMRAPKQYAEVVKRGYGRRAAHDRAISYAKNADPILRQMIEDGRINQVLPLIRAAIEDNEYGQFVAEAYQRRQRGESLLQQAIREHQAPVANPPQQVDLAALETQDPFLAEQVRPIVAPLMAEIQTLKSGYQTWEQQRQAQEQAAREAQQRSIQIANELRGAHEDLAAMYQGRFSTERGPNDPLWQTANQIAREGQYCERYGYRAGMIFAGQAAVAMEQERLAATQSPTAQVLQQAEARLLTAAQSEAARSAQTVSGGGPGASAPAPIPPKPTPKNPDGTLKPKDEYLAAVAAWHQQYGRMKQG